MDNRNWTLCVAFVLLGKGTRGEGGHGKTRRVCKQSALSEIPK